jgi:hypothetical protein
MDLSAIYHQLILFIGAFLPIILAIAIPSASTFTTFNVRALGMDDCFTRQAGDYFTNELCHFDFYFLPLATLFCSFLQREGRVTALQKICWKYCLHPKFDRLVNCFKV